MEEYRREYTFCESDLALIEARNLIRLGRLVAGSRFKVSNSKQRVNYDILHVLFTESFARSPAWIESELKIISRCVLDRRTLGKLASDTFLFGLPELKFLAMQALRDV